MKKSIKKILKFLSISIAGIFFVYATILSITIPYYINYIESFEPVKTSSPSLIEHYELQGSDPSHYGLDFEDVSFESKSTKGLLLTGWYIKSDIPSLKCIYFIHGWMSSSASCLPFLEIINKYNINKDHNIFFINLRNSGNSTRMATDLGYKTSFDVVEGLRFIESQGSTKVIILALSMGAMATANALNLHANEITSLNIDIDKIIMDSPLSNATHAIKSKDSAVQIFDNLLYTPFFYVVNKRWDNMLWELKFSKLLPNLNNNKILIMQSTKDRLTRIQALHEEISDLETKPQIEIFDQGPHARIYKFNKDKYAQIIKKFIYKD